jgi:hypothetical protein
MGPELIVAIIGPVAGAVIGTFGFMSRRNINLTDTQLNAIAENVEVISHQVTNLQIQLPTSYVTKDEFARHVRNEENFHNKMIDELRELREEVIALRYQSHQ